MRTQLVLTSLLLATLSPPPASAERPTVPTCAGWDCPYTFLLGFYGFDYRVPAAENTPVLPPAFMEVGDQLASVGIVSTWGGCVAPSQDPRQSEFTMHAVFGPVLTVDNYLHLWAYSMASGRVRIYHDALAADGGSPATPGVNPPNATAPSSYTDESGRGTLLLGGVLHYPGYFYNGATEQGSWAAEVEWDEGPLLASLPWRRWPLSVQFELRDVPPGYSGLARGLIAEDKACPSVPVRPNTWGALKAMYRSP